MRYLVAALDPRRSLGTKVGWIAVGLTLAMAGADALWLGRMTREGLMAQHCRQLALDTEQVAYAVEEALSSRLQALRAAAAILANAHDTASPQLPRSVLNDLQSAYPEFESIALADDSGSLLAATSGIEQTENLRGRSWFAQSLRASWIGDVAATDPLASAHVHQSRALVMSTPVHSARAAVDAVIAARLRWDWLDAMVRGLRLSLREQTGPYAMGINADGVVLLGPQEFVGKRWPGVVLRRIELTDPGGTLPLSPLRQPEIHVERLTDGSQILVSAVAIRPFAGAEHPQWTLQLVEPLSRADQRADGLWLRVVWMALAMGGTAALAGVVLARRVTASLRRLSASVDAVGAGIERRLQVPGGADEVARLGIAFSDLLDALQQERAGLSTLSAELERRVLERTREVERLAREARGVAVVRERLRIARDLHDTLAHSIMAVLAEVRILRKLATIDPAALPAELERAEQLARDGLIEARASITRLRFSGVRDLGLGGALIEALDRFSERTGLAVDRHVDPAAMSLGDESAEAIFRISEEALRNVERHAHASSVRVLLHAPKDGGLELTVADDGVGFDPGARHAGQFGIVGMHEQAQLIGAQLRIASRPGGGAVISLVVGVSSGVGS